jgi:hypothetical protein
MTKYRINKQEREKLLEKIALSKELNEKKKKRYNHLYRKSLFFKASWAIRIIYLLLFILVSIFYHHSKGFASEKVLNVGTDISYRSPKYSLSKITTLYFETDRNNYNAYVTGIKVPEFKAADTLLIEYNIFGRPIYFTKEEWPMKYGLNANFIGYFLILFVTILSMFFNDGLDRFTDKILMIIWFLNLITIGVFFFT